VGGFLLRLALALVLVLATYNPEGHSFVHWVLHGGDGLTPPKALTGVALTIAWVVAFSASWRGLGVIGTGLMGALVGTLIWTFLDWADPEIGSRAVSYVVLFAIALVLAIGTSWSRVRQSFARRFGPGDDEEE
jgi:hypothetical protein